MKPRNLVRLVGLLIAVLPLLAGCPEIAAEDVDEVVDATVRVNPEAATLVPSESIAISATVSGASTSDVTWSASAGTISGTGQSVTYKAPGAQGDYVITATSVVDPSASAEILITVVEATVAISPTSAALASGESITFSANVTGIPDPSVSWSATGGTLVPAEGTNTATYTAPSTRGTYEVTATSVRDPSAKATASVTSGIVVVDVTTSTAEVLTSDIVFARADVSGATDQRVTWTTSHGAIVDQGLNTVRIETPSASATFEVRATSWEDVSVSDTVTIVAAACLPSDAYVQHSWFNEYDVERRFQYKTCYELGSVTEVDFGDSGFAGFGGDLTGIEYARAVKVIFVPNFDAGFPLADFFGPMSKLPVLEHLALNGYYGGTGRSSIDLTGIGELSALRELDLINFQGDVDIGNDILNDLSPLTDLSDLVDLRVAATRVSDLAPLAALTNLTTLDLSSNAITDVTPLGNLINLTSLSLRNNSVDDIGSLLDIQALASVDLRFNDLDSCDASDIQALIDRGVAVEHSVDLNGTCTP